MKPPLLPSLIAWVAVALGVALGVVHLEFLCGGAERFGVTTLALSALANCDWLLVIGGGAALGWLHSRLDARTARRAAPCLLVAGAGLAWFWLGGPDAGALAGERGRAVLGAGALLSGALALGAWLARRVLPPSPASATGTPLGGPASPAPATEEDAPSRLLFAAGLGLGAYALLALALLAVAGRHVGVGATALVALSWALGGRAALRVLAAAWRRAAAALDASGGGGWAVAGALAAGLLLLSRFCWLPTLDYDVLEYHALLPRDCLLAGRALFQPYNMFSAFPQNSEMLTLLALAMPWGADGNLVAGAGGAPGPGALAAAQLLNFAFLPLTLAALAALVARLLPVAADDAGGAGRGAMALAATLASLATLAMPGVLQWSPVLYVENGFAFYFLLAVGAALRAAAEPPAGRWGRWAALAGVFAGLCAGAKYTGLLFAGAAGCAVILVFARGWWARLGGAALCGGFCWLLLAPWLLKNYLTTGNPFYPLWNLGFGVAGWDATQEMRFYLAHRPGWGMAADARAAAFSLGECGWQFLRLFLGRGNPSFGPLAFAGAGGWLLAWWGGAERDAAPAAAPGPAAAAPVVDGASPRRDAAALLLWLGLLFLVWFFFTHRLERFFHAGLLLAAVLGGAGAGRLLVAAARLPGRLFAGATAMAAAMLVAALLGNAAAQEIGGARVGDVLGGEVSGEEWLRRNHRYACLREWLAAAPRRSPGAGAPRKVLLVGPADVFWLPPGECEWATVFDRHPFMEELARAENCEQLAAALRARGFTHVYFHWREWQRLQSTYYQAYAPSPEKRRLLAGFLRAGLRELWRTPSLDPAWQAAFAAANPGLFPGGAVPVDLLGELPPAPLLQASAPAPAR